MARTNKHLETKLIHAGVPDPRVQGAVVTPIFQSAMFEYAGETSYHDLKYIRLSNTPGHAALHRKLAAVEGAEAALSTASGMAAISTTLLAVLSAGDHLLAQRCLYGGTHDLITHDFPGMGLSFDFVGGSDPASWERALRPTTRAFYVEAMSNPLLEVADLEAVVAFARARGLCSIIDNTFASPVNFSAIALGFDVSIHSCTKYMNGHSDIVAGAVLGSAERVTKITQKLNHLGGSLDPHAVFLLDRGMKTMALRVRRQNESALAIARFLEGHPAVAKVNYPGLESHPAHARARRLFRGFGGVLSFELRGGVAAAGRLMESVSLPVVAPSLGGVETLITRPAVTSHAGLDPAARRGLGISDELVRLSVGIEAIEDLLEDLEDALAQAAR
jgi:cystathionine beta-lyase/cystathionine gamma-synthase